MFFINEKDIEDIALLLPKKVPTVKGTRMIHQVLTSEKGKLSYREVSCFCENNNWDTGKLWYCKFTQKDFSFSSNDSDTSKKSSCFKKEKCLSRSLLK